mmetsp:Transcript_29074/g.53242  ORF Transcript_29074/g.53242 Transcript_29074/m.53242 type:complete len:239 (+) Transcript_29074:748-1464(+)
MKRLSCFVNFAFEINGSAKVKEVVWQSSQEVAEVLSMLRETSSKEAVDWFFLLVSAHAFCGCLFDCDFCFFSNITWAICANGSFSISFSGLILLHNVLGEDPSGSVKNPLNPFRSFLAHFDLGLLANSGTTVINDFDPVSFSLVISSPSLGDECFSSPSFESHSGPQSLFQHQEIDATTLAASRRFCTCAHLTFKRRRFNCAWREIFDSSAAFIADGTGPRVGLVDGTLSLDAIKMPL